MLLSGLSKELESIKQNYQNNDWTGVRVIAHKWKGGASYCGANRLEQACQQLEGALRKESLEEAEVFYQQLIQVAYETKAAAREALAVG